MWKDIRKALAVISLIVGAFSATIPDPYSKIGFGVALGFSNAAIYIKSEEKEDVAK